MSFALTKKRPRPSDHVAAGRVRRRPHGVCFSASGNGARGLPHSRSLDFQSGPNVQAGTTKIESAFPDASTRPPKTAMGAMNILVMGKAKSPDCDLDTEDTAATEQRRDTLKRGPYSCRPEERVRDLHHARYLGEHPG